VAEGKLLRIGELSRRSGVSPELLRAWERRYGVLRPTRSPGGLRLYSLEDLERVRRMREHLAEGLAAAEAAALSTAPATDEAAAPALHPGAVRRELTEALERFDEASTHAILDRLLAAATLDSVLDEVLLPYLNELGARWASGEITPGQEHFASNLLRGRLLGLARGWGHGLGPRALLACPPGERHDLGLVAFGLALRARGWRIGYLGSDTPLGSVEQAARFLDPEVIVLSAVTAERFEPVLDEVRELARHHRVCLGGAGASTIDVEALGAIPLANGLVAEANRLTAIVSTPRAG
jgi:DNA-binding transcriptional MerR regulator